MRCYWVCMSKFVGFCIFVLGASGYADELPTPMKAGIIGLDAHALPWTKIINDPKAIGALADAIKIFRLAKEHNVPCFSSSSLRFAQRTIGIRENPRVGDVRGCDQYSPCPLEPHHPDFFWYGIHGVEPLIVEIIKFFKTGKPPVSAEETLEIFAFMEAADESKRQGSRPVTLENVMDNARLQVFKEFLCEERPGP